MPELSIRFTTRNDRDKGPIQASLVRLDQGTSTSPAPFKPPLDDQQLEEIRWYLEEFPHWPVGPDYDRAGRTAAALEDWGRALLDSVTAKRDAARLWQQFADSTEKDRLLTIDATDPRVLRLPWELLANEQGHLFAQGISVRRRLQQATVAQTVPAALPLPVRLLVVVCRPLDAGFIDPRAVSRPLLEAIEGLGSRVAVEFLSPPTLEALTRRLRDKKAPPVHVVHFDGHGVYDAKEGLGYLLFEDPRHGSDRVDANRLGTLLSNCGVPLMVLNACQSAGQEKANPYASVAARLIRAGVGSVLAMNYSVLVTAACRFVEAFYGGLAEGLTVGQAVDAGRLGLLGDEARLKLARRDAAGKVVEETVSLRDWFLPALYQQAADPVIFAPAAGAATSAGQPRALSDPQAPGGLPAGPLHGFHGRAQEMLKLERAFAEKPLVVLHGFGGMGKTALATEAGRWFHRTGRFPGGAAFISFEHGGSLQQLCSWVGQAVGGDPDFVLGAGDPVERIAALLGERPALVILDNFESVLGAAPLMPADELKAVLDAVWTWAAGAGGAGRKAGPKSCFLITTRDTAFNDARYSPSQACSHLELGGLESHEALELAAAVLYDHGIDRAGVDRQGLSELIGFLGGHPLSLYLVLPHLRRHTPAELIRDFEARLPGFTQGKARERDESLAVSLEFSLRRLGEATRAALPDLAVFQGGAFENILLEITGIDPELWKAARAELEGAALATVEALPSVALPFLRFHPTLLPYLAGRLPEARRRELEERYWQHYYGATNYLYQLDIQHPHEARAIAALELPNLLRAFDLALAAGAAAEAVGFADRIVRFLDIFGRRREGERLREKLAGLQAGLTGAGGITKAEYLLLNQQGEARLAEGRAGEAEGVFRGLLERLEAGAGYDAAYDHALTLLWVGRSLSWQGQPARAIPIYRQALAEFERLGESDKNAKTMAGMVNADLGDALAASGHFDKAQSAYERGLEISRAVGDQREVGVILGQLGALALRLGDLKAAQASYSEAWATFRALGEPQSEAVIWHQLGVVAQEAENWAEAERCYREAVRLKDQVNDRPGLAKSYNQLALVAVGAGRPGDAESWYLREIEIDEQIGNPKELAMDFNNLADLYLAQGRLEEAGRLARRAVEIDGTLDLSAEPWKTYSLLARIAMAQGRAGEAADWRRKERQSRDAYPGTRYQVEQLLLNFQPVIAGVLAACQGDGPARARVEALFEPFRRGNWQIVEAIRRIWAGERDAEALTAEIDYNSRAIVLAILRQLGGEEAPAPGAPPAGAGAQVGTGGAPPEGEDASAAAEVERIRQEWDEVITGVVDACTGSAEAVEMLESFFQDMKRQDDWRLLIATLQRILAGERDPQALLAGLDPTDTVVVVETLHRLGVRVLPPAAGSPAAPGRGEGIGLDDFLGLVVSACGPEAPAGLGERVFQAARAMETQQDGPPDLHALGRVLIAILTGDRAPDLSALSPELAEKVQGVLEAIRPADRPEGGEPGG